MFAKLSQQMAGKILKGLYAAAMALLTGLATVLTEPGATFTAITAGQWVTIAAFTLGAFGGTFGLAGWAGPSRLNGQDGSH
jgi:hypothetical protein